VSPAGCAAVNIRSTPRLARGTTPVRTLDDIQAGLVLGRYEFLLPIAKGGMAAVWAARAKGARGFQKIVAVKTILPALSDNTEFESMFLDEARTAARIRHPNVVEIIDLGEQDDVLYLVMEWIDGEPLVALIRAAAKGSPIPIPIAVKMMADAAQGLHAAHQLKDEEGKLLGVVHRDVSPQNILVSYEGIVKIVDFGVAKASGRMASETVRGQLKGKVPFMSPEQVKAQPIDRRTDVFAMGTLLYQLTTGKHPFRGDDDLTTLTNIVSRPIPPPRRVANAIYPAPLEEVVMHALERDPDKRFQTAAELYKALDEVFTRGNVRASTEDVSAFVTSQLGARGDQWRERLKAAIVVADKPRDAMVSIPDVTPAKGVVPPGAESQSQPSGKTVGISDRSVVNILEARTATATGVVTAAPVSDGAAKSTGRSAIAISIVAAAAVVAGIAIWRLGPAAIAPSASSEVPAAAAPATQGGAQVAARPEPPPEIAPTQSAAPSSSAIVAQAAAEPITSRKSAPPPPAPRPTAKTAPTAAPTARPRTKGVDLPDF
jgi:eukaryotic-like serine/threonine-protein kinase